MIFHRHCRAVGCTLRGFVVQSQASTCLGCGGPLTDTDEAYADSVEASTGIRPDMTVMRAVTSDLSEERLRTFARSGG